jgi:hypothetical protein
VGVGGATLAAYKLGFLGPAQTTSEHQRELARAALAGKRWDAPPGDNVLDLTDEGLRKWPNDPQLIDIRHTACDELTKLAIDAWKRGDKSEGLRLIRLANRLHPEDPAVQSLLASYEAESGDAGAATSSTDAGLPPLRPTSTQPAQPRLSLTGPRASIEVTPGTPRIGSPATLVAKVQMAAGPPKAPPSEALFEIDGPNAQNIHLPASCDATGTCSAQFTFLEAGKFTVTFSSKADGQTIKNQRIVMVGAPAPQGSDDLPPLPSATGKWM